MSPPFRRKPIFSDIKQAVFHPMTSQVCTGKGPTATTGLGGEGPRANPYHLFPVSDFPKKLIDISGQRNGGDNDT